MARCLCWNAAWANSSIWNLSSVSSRANGCVTEIKSFYFTVTFHFFWTVFTKLGHLCVSPYSDTNDTSLSESPVNLQRQEHTKLMCKRASKSQKRGVKKYSWNKRTRCLHRLFWRQEHLTMEVLLGSKVVSLDNQALQDWRQWLTVTQEKCH